MSLPAIHVEHLSKRYRIGSRQQAHTTLVDALSDAMARPLRTAAAWWGGHAADPSDEEVWALRDISFDVSVGEVVGIVGRNGAGKSTLLKILSRITEPTEGFAGLCGRVGSLLEVGTGFHPELTGRENVFLNGAILGMRRAEIREKFDEIVEFSGVGRFLDTPVKFYSSGMYMRLAFSVAAHLEPEILLVDEVLAVGDAAFQTKCLGKMGEVAREGRTVVFVSHNTAAVRTLCPRAILLDEGRVAMDGDAQSVVMEYLARSRRQEEVPLGERTDRVGTGRLRFTDARFMDEAGRPVTETMTGRSLTIEAAYEIEPGLDEAELIVSVSLWDALDNLVLLFASDEMGVKLRHLGRPGKIVVQIPRLLLRGGSYALKLFASHRTTEPENFCDSIERAASLTVLPGDHWSSGRTNRAGAYCVLDGTMSNE